MLSANIITPRPRPPSQNRRAASMQSYSSSLKSPPPPYAASSSLSSLSDSEDHVPPPDPLLTPCPQAKKQKPRLVGVTRAHNEDWPTEKSREQLSDLLLKADGLLKERDNELSLRSAVCKNLHENNLSLRSKHQALLARLPGTPTDSQSSSPVGSTSPILHSPHYYSGSISRGSSESSDPSYPSSSTRSTRHARRISVSPSEIALLSDQNAELLDKLEKIESESTHADQTGRRALKKLENEILFLREELEKTQAKSQELEEKAKFGYGLGAADKVEEVCKRKQEREAKLRAIRYNRSETESTGDESDAEEEVRDFAPGGALSISGFTSDTKRSMTAPEPARYPDPFLDSSPGSSFPLDHDTDTSFPPPGPDLDCTPRPLHPEQTVDDDVTPRPPPPPEYALISQLVSKIKELEQTNKQIIEQQAATAAKLEAVQRDTENISKVYESLGDASSVGVEWKLEDGPDDDQPHDDGSSGAKNLSASETVTSFRSLRNTLALAVEGAWLDVDKADSQNSFDCGIRFEGSKQSTIRTTLGRGDILRNLDNGPGPASSIAKTRSRKSVVGLFDPPTTQDDEQHDTLTAVDADVSMSGLPPIPFPPTSSWSMEINGSGLMSPTLSSLSLSAARSQSQSQSQAPSPFDSTHPTLGSELGSEFGDDWGLKAGNHHLRTSSLYDLSQMSLPASSSPSPEPREDRPPAFYVSLQPPTPERSQVKPQNKGKSKESTPENWRSARYRRMSQTVKSRTSQWVDGRFKDTFLKKRSPDSESGPRSFSMHMPAVQFPIPSRLSNALDVVLETFSGRKDAVVLNTPTGSDKDLHASISLSAKGEQEKHNGRVTAFILELWLWLQFAMIILVFLWAMAKRGPKTILDEAERRRTTTSL